MSVATAPRPTRRGAFVVTLLVMGLAALSIGPLGCGSEAEEEAAEEAVGESDKRVELNMGVDDRTTENPPSEQLAIKVPGHDLWSPNLEYGGTSERFGEYPAGENYELHIYPEGEDGPRETVPFSMKPDMMSGTASSKTYVEIYDDRFVVRGPAVPDGHVDIDREGASPSDGS